MPPRTLVKWGGSLITDKTTPFTVRKDVLNRLAHELATCWPDYAGRLVLGHGSGSFGHVAATRAGLRGDTDLLPSAQALSTIQAAVSTLHRQVIDALRDANLPAFSFAPSSLFTTTNGTPTECDAAPLRHALALGALPVVYGDVTLDTSRDLAICSTETVFRALIPALRRRDWSTARVLWCGSTDGVYDADGTTLDPLTPEAARRLIETVDAPAGTDVTGGMAHRLDTACALANDGIASLILNGLVANRLPAALREEEIIGTRIPAI